MNRVQKILLAGLLLMTAVAGLARAEDSTRVRDVIYGRKYGMALTLDVIKPAKPNGVGVIFMVSGGFTSDISMMSAGYLAQFKPFLDRGQTLFLVCHGSQPRFTVDEIVKDIHRSVRFIRTHASEYGVDPERLGICGASSGGYLSLAIATGGREGIPASKDPVDHSSSRVQAAAVFFPPTDLVDYGKPGRTFLEYEPVQFVWHTMGLQGKPRDEQIQRLREMSPMAAISKDTAPTLLIHGDNDLLVPHEQSERFAAKLTEQKVPNRFDLRKGAGHGWPKIGEDFAVMADWFDKYLAPQPEKGSGKADEKPTDKKPS